MPLKRNARSHVRNTRSRVRKVKTASPIQNSSTPSVSVVIPAMNERRTIALVIANARKVHPDTEVIVVVNGSTDGTEAIARRMGATVVVYNEALGHDVGRSVGAGHANGNVILFTDGDIVIPARKLKPFVTAIEAGTDVALNRYNGRTKTTNGHSVVIAKHALNAALRRDDLAGSSLTTIPHAISRKMLDTVGAAALSVPPLALTMAIHKGLNVKRVAFVEVGRTNPKRRRRRKNDPLKGLIIGDHLEAMEWVMDQTDLRGGYTDLVRKRDRVR